jgi:hypothetical protein
MLSGPTPRKVVRPMRRLRVFRRGSVTSPVGSVNRRRTDVRESLAVLANDSLPCQDIAPRSAGPREGLITMLSIDSRDRADVLDLDRAFFMEGGGAADVSWLSLPPAAPGESFRLLLRVAVKVPVTCDFVVGIPIDQGTRERLRIQLPYLLAADGLAMGFDVPVTVDSAITVAAPTDRRPLFAAVSDLYG